MTGFHEVSLWLKFSMHTKIPNLYESLHSLSFNMKDEHLSLEFPRFLTWVCFCNWPDSWRSFQWIALGFFRPFWRSWIGVLTLLISWQLVGASTRCFWTNLRRDPLGGKEVGRWLEDVRRWYGVVWAWIWHGMGFWYGCGHIMLSRPWWSVGEVDSRLQKGYKNCPRIWGLNFRNLVVGEILKKNPPRLKWWIFFLIPAAPLLLRRHLSTAHTCRAGTVWRELLLNGSRSITLWKFG